MEHTVARVRLISVATEVPPFGPSRNPFDPLVSAFQLLAAECLLLTPASGAELSKLDAEGYPATG